MDQVTALQAVHRLDAWLETMRGPDGYTGPVAHWWRNCLQFTGAGLDWRYEGIIIGYLNAFEKTRQEKWLTKARRAGDDLVQGQLPTGNFSNSCFELNPYTGGTPHEAACDAALLRLAGVLRERGDPTSQTYLSAAERNIRAYQIDRLWDSGAQAIRDDPQTSSFVPNKAATLVEALVRLAQLTGDETLVEEYALPTVEAILEHQVLKGPLRGAIHQYSLNGRRVARFFPYYVARCVPGLLAAYHCTDKERYVEAAGLAMEFVLRWRLEDGSFPQVIYPGGRIKRYPQWVAATGDILRAMTLMAAHGLRADLEPTLAWLLRGQETTGAFRTAHGFASQISQRPPGSPPEFRDLLPVVGWSSMALRYLTEALPDANGHDPAADTELQSEASETRSVESECVFRDEACILREDGEMLELRRNGKTLYRWQKGTPWAEVCAVDLLWK